jgi:hypothetical protein
LCGVQSATESYRGHQTNSMDNRPKLTIRPPSASAGKTAFMERKSRHAAIESNQAVRALVEDRDKYQPAMVRGLDGRVLQVEAIPQLGEAGSDRGPWSVAFVAGGVNISVPRCNFAVIGGTQPPFTVSGAPVDYTDASKNKLAIGAGTHVIYLECSVDDTRPEQINTLSVRLVWFAVGSEPDNVAGKRYITVAQVDTGSRAAYSYLGGSIQTARRGDRDSVSNMVWWLN